MTHQDAVSVEALRHAERTSIVRPHRLPIPPSLLVRAGWCDGQRLVVRSEAGALVVAAEGHGRPVRLAANGLAGTPDAFDGLHTGQVVEWEMEPGRLAARVVHGLSHDSYTCPKPDTAGIAVPPSWLVQVFTGNPNITGYLRSGRRQAAMLAGLAHEAGDGIDPESILDFGCGVGRVLRFMPASFEANLVGYDLHAPSIEWCRAHMGFARWEHGRHTPPIPEPDGRFDLIYAISVLTHLDEQHQDMWLAEWQRIIKPGGLLVVTYRSEHFVEQFIKPKAAARAEAIVDGWRQGNGFTYLADDGWAGIFPDYYSDAYHASAYVERHWGRFFNILGLYPAGSMALRQDVALLRAPA